MKNAVICTYGKKSKELEPDVFDYKIDYYADNDVRKVGDVYKGRKVISFQEAIEMYKDSKLDVFLVPYDHSIGVIEELIKQMSDEGGTKTTYTFSKKKWKNMRV